MSAVASAEWAYAQLAQTAGDLPASEDALTACALVLLYHACQYLLTCVLRLTEGGGAGDAYHGRAKRGDEEEDAKRSP